jgi:hypothetical protein
MTALSERAAAIVTAAPVRVANSPPKRRCGGESRLARALQSLKSARSHPP